ncbi:intraflagellar transport protein 56-like [Cimex lectularius]|uniref:Tetratricopeptide repeat protein 26 n=1 Tax=Cimex lectularius TaxID=79782 RepID=A0A8I6SIA5_CIMLE|nr:intraflagellar transport protein 56-like [Cimex lectularius]
MILSRLKGGTFLTEGSGANRTIPTLDQFLVSRDYMGAITFLEFEQSTGRSTDMTDRWLGYCAFHLGDYKRAMQIYEAMSQLPNPPNDTLVNLACCYFFLGLYQQADTLLEKVPDCPLKVRLQFHLCHKLGNEVRLIENHKKLENTIEDSLSLAALHYLRSHHKEAIDIYKKILLDKRELLALNVYAALCYYKLDYYDVSQELLGTYLQKYPDSAIALNLKACNYFKLENGKAAENEIKTLLDLNTSFAFGHDLIRHNLVVFRGGVGALQVLPPLVDIIPEARLNLVIYYFKQGEFIDAYDLVKNLEPSEPHEYILKGIVNVAVGQETNSREHLKVAEQYFLLVGNSETECDTIPGRQCMASLYFLQKQFEDVNVYLTSIRSYFLNDDNFNFNYAQAKSALENYKEAEEIFLLIQNEKIVNDYIYITHLARAYIMNGKPQQAWELYLKMDSSPDSFNLLLLIANDCYRMGHFYHSAKAFDLLERLDPNPEYWEGKRGACVGAFQMIIANKSSSDLLPNIIQLLKGSTNPQVESITKIMKRWAKEQKINI